VTWLARFFFEQRTDALILPIYRDSLVQEQSDIKKIRVPSNDGLANRNAPIKHSMRRSIEDLTDIEPHFLLKFSLE
jgi:hypothetical protein